MRAGRLVSLMLILQRRGRVTAAELARELEVSERTVFRDIEELSGAGVPVYATRGPGGGFQLLDGAARGALLADWTPTARQPGRPRRALVKISPEGRQLATVVGLLQPLRVRRAVPPDDQGWVVATFRLRNVEAVAVEVLALSPHVEVLQPAALRNEVAARLSAAVGLYADRSAQ